MAAPVGADAQRWNAAVRAVAKDAGITNTEADTVLNNLWVNPSLENQSATASHAKLARFLEVQGVVASTAHTALLAYMAAA